MAESTVIATTNRDIAKMVLQGEFRMDLFYLLNAFSLHIPPLRDRPEDISALARYYLSFFSTKYAKSPTPSFSPEAEELMCAHRWSGNVRELKNVIERLVVLGTDDRILPEQPPKEIMEGEAPAGRPEGASAVFGPWSAVTSSVLASWWRRTGPRDGELDAAGNHLAMSSSPRENP